MRPVLSKLTKYELEGLLRHTEGERDKLRELADGRADAIDRRDIQIADLQAECDQWQKKLTEDAWPEIERLRKIRDAARALDEHKDQGYATLVSHLIRLHETLVEFG